MQSDTPLPGFLSWKRLENGPWQAFERNIARLFVHQGWPDVRVVGGTGDKGADVIATSDEREVVVQAKFRSESHLRAGKRIVEDVKRAMDHYSIDEGIAVTNVRLSNRAGKYLQGLRDTGYNIKKIEGATLHRIYDQLPRWPKREDPPFTYQVKAIDTIVEMYKEGLERTLLAMATGLGKTFVAGKAFKKILKENPRKEVLVLANQRPLVKQFEKALWKHLPKDVSTHLWYGGEEPGFEGGITIATFQTVRNHIDDSKYLKQYRIVVVDEAHHAPADTYRDVIERIDPDFLLGMTATPWRGDEKSLSDLFGPPQSELTIDIIEALKNNYLAKVDYRLHCDNLDWDLIHGKSSENHTLKDLNKKLFVPERDEAILREIEKVWEEIHSERAIVYCASIEHARRMERMLRERGYSAKCLESYQDNRENEKRLRAFRRGDVEILTAVNMLNEGVDIPEVDLIVFLRVTHSRRIFLQQLGRGLRLTHGKEKVVVLDFVADIKRVAETMDIKSGVTEGGKKPEVVETGFDINFSSNKAQGFFEEYLRDKASVQTRNNEEKIKFP